MKLQGIFIPIVIPFDYSGDLYPAKIKHNIEKWNRTAIAGYVVSGAESVYLSTEEKVRVWELVAEYSAPEKLLIAATAMPSVRETVALTNQAESFGYKAALIRSPETAKEIYFSAVADRAKIPLIAAGEGNFAHPNIVSAKLAECSSTIA